MRLANAQAPPPRGLVGRADLLRALVVRAYDRLALDSDSDAWFGYVRREEPPPAEAPVSAPIPVAGGTVQSAPTHRVPLQMAHTVAIVKRESREAPQRDESVQRNLSTAHPLTEEQARSRFASRQARYEDLVPLARLMPALRRVLGSTRLGQVDLVRLAERLANHDLPKYLPRRRSLRWHPDLVVVLDFSARLWPYRQDMHRLAKQLNRLCGRGGVSLRIVDGDPSTTWVDWHDAQRRSARADEERPWKMPPPGTPVLLVSDMGLLLRAESPVIGAWRRFAADLVRAQVRPMLLAPLGSGQLDAAVVGAMRLLRWSPDARMRLERARGMGHASQTAPNALTDSRDRQSPDHLAQLLALMSAVRRIDPPLLRAMRRMVAGAGNAWLEGAAWCHPDVDASFTASVRRDESEKHLARFRALSPGTQRALDSLRRLHHGHLRAVVTHEETLLLAAHAPTAVDDKEVQESRGFVASLVRSLKEGDRIDASAWRGVARELAARADERMLAHDRDLFDALVSASYAPDELELLPDWADPSRLQEAGRDDQAFLVLDLGRSAILLQAHAPHHGQYAMGAPIHLPNGLVKVRTSHGGREVVRWLPLEQRPEVVCALSVSQPVELLTASEAITVASVPRPRGARAWGVDPDGLFVESPLLAGVHTRWREELDCSRQLTGAGWRVRAPATGGGPQFGIDDYGVYADVAIATNRTPVVQRFRWIEPGTFLMGSPADEPERSEDEGPQHLVTLTRGFWLADTACTQEAWAAVMGENPSRFSGEAQRPVENVTWTQVQRFLAALGEGLPGSVAELPTEAEWEYACRAGTTTAFSFGDQVTPEWVNYDGNYPYAGGAKGLYRQQTVAVKSLPPNGWGLYEMHGNVWEWCADRQRSYDDAPQVDPIGPVDASDGARAPRALRGGSWSNRARRARSAFRFALRPGFANDDLGFRVCLRSIEPGHWPPGGRPPATGSPRDEASSPPQAQSILERARDVLLGTRRKRR